ncbi:MAG: hypothetical protein JWM85_2323 [Acidimicrobiaceae bacterium]|nr:hypothetical protein [Acidimicrobiaceae bacterium]
MNIHRMNRLRLVVPMATLVGLGSGMLLVPSASASPDHGVASPTTLDACGYFGGEQTPAFSHTSGDTTVQAGTWVGVSNNYGGGPVASLGSVHGAFFETTTTYGPKGEDTTGTEWFTSNAGQISQTFTYGPDVTGGYSVIVTATRDLSFLTSNTNVVGGCYSGTFPRP